MRQQFPTLKKLMKKREKRRWKMVVKSCVTTTTPLRACVLQPTVEDTHVTAFRGAESTVF
jgi:hypothetical protein